MWNRYTIDQTECRILVIRCVVTTTLIAFGKTGVNHIIVVKVFLNNQWRQHMAGISFRNIVKVMRICIETSGQNASEKCIVITGLFTGCVGTQTSSRTYVFPFLDITYTRGYCKTVTHLHRALEIHRFGFSVLSPIANSGGLVKHRLIISSCSRQDSNWNQIGSRWIISRVVLIQHWQSHSR